MEERGGSEMKYILALSLLFLAGCANPLTRLVPKIEMPEPPKELMAPPKPLKTIIPAAPAQSELLRDVTPAGQ
jgi:hypothetical protein